MSSAGSEWSNSDLISEICPKFENALNEIDYQVLENFTGEPKKMFRTMTQLKFMVTHLRLK